jgi:2Fe-2S ferredoxin
MPIFIVITADNIEHQIDVPVGCSVLDACNRAGLPMEGLCGGEMACSTCHIIVEPSGFIKLAEASKNEEDMLDLIPTLTETSRQGCQIKASDELDDLKVYLP